MKSTLVLIMLATATSLAAKPKGDDPNHHNTSSTEPFPYSQAQQDQRQPHLHKRQGNQFMRHKFKPYCHQDTEACQGTEIWCHEHTPKGMTPEQCIAQRKPLPFSEGDTSGKGNCFSLFPSVDPKLPSQHGLQQAVDKYLRKHKTDEALERCFGTEVWCRLHKDEQRCRKSEEAFPCAGSSSPEKNHPQQNIGQQDDFGPPSQNSINNTSFSHTVRG
ncbi:hypothetical protein L249_6461 [Ophiocordyceps polyrhachis-furcata BCC 54312]|uniref:Uncharacterized protein n=1 Tax=Ophiocordyceps polyrhachis-furcata BCC 54312 TaxID=1330021 RepID=A0A367LLF4_9HYPO|nr:hypothetical protein L249_6461 [Ophiocordyceps polyrhachis-furcata BCC 54312]